MGNIRSAEEKVLLGLLESIPDLTRFVDGVFLKLPVALQVFRPTGENVVVGRAFHDLMGWDPPPSFNILTDSGAKESGLSELVGEAAHGRTVTGDTLWYKPSKTLNVTESDRLDMPTTVFPLFDAQDNVEWVVAVLYPGRAVDDHRLARNSPNPMSPQIREKSEQWINEALATIPIVAWDVDIASGTVRFSRNAIEILGLSAEELILSVSNGLMFIYPEDRERVQKLVSDSAGDEVVKAQFRFVKPHTDKMILLEGNCIVTHDPATGKATGIRGAAVEITQWAGKALSERAHTKQSNLAAESAKIKKAFLSNMSHDLRTPLNSIIGFSDLLIDEEIPIEKRQEFISHINKSGHHLLTLVNSLLDLAKLEAGEIEFHPEVGDVESCLSAAIEHVSDSANSKEIHLDVRVEYKLKKATIDQQYFQKVAENLLAYAIYVSPKKSTVTLGVLQIEDHLCLEVGNASTEKQPIDPEAIFNRFEQLEGLDRAVEGIGLGLALVKRLVEAQGGKVGIRTDPQRKGSVFYANFPMPTADH
jgi:signal transduction histidine kinase